MFDLSAKKLMVTAQDPEKEEQAVRLAEHLNAPFCQSANNLPEDVIMLSAGKEGLSLSFGKLSMKGDLTYMIPRIRRSNLNTELLVKAAGLNKMQKK